ncbi:MAG: hypothetical protein OHK0023_26030 [Anaerolineae bacterium]
MLYFTVFGFAIFAILALFVLLTYNDIIGRLGSSQRKDAVAVAPGVTVAPWVTINEEKAFPMGLTAGPNGTLYLSIFGTGAIHRLNSDGSLSFVKGLTAPGAIAAGPDGTLYVIDYTGVDMRAYGQLKRISPAGEVSLFGDALNATYLPLLSGLAVDRVGNVYVTHADSASVWRVTPSGLAEVWWRIPELGAAKALPTGLGYDAQGDALLVTDAATGTLYRVPLAAMQPVGEVLYRQKDFDLRGVTLDDTQRPLLISWKNENGALHRLEAEGTLTLLAERFRAPTAIVYHEGKAVVVNSGAPGIISQIRTDPPFTVDVVTLPQ